MIWSIQSSKHVLSRQSQKAASFIWAECTHAAEVVGYAACIRSSHMPRRAAFRPLRMTSCRLKQSELVLTLSAGPLEWTAPAHSQASAGRVCYDRIRLARPCPKTHGVHSIHVVPTPAQACCNQGHPQTPLKLLQDIGLTVLTVLTASSTWASLWRFCSTRSWFTSWTADLRFPSRDSGLEAAGTSC